MSDFITWEDLDNNQKAVVTGVVDQVRNGTRTISVRGKAGTGKSSVMRSLINNLSDSGYETQVMATTNKATQVLRAKGIETAKTIHSSIYMPKFDGKLAGAVAELTKLASNNMELDSPESQTPACWALSEQNVANIEKALQYVIEAFFDGGAENVDELTVYSILEIDVWEWFIGWDRRTEMFERVVALIDEASMATDDQLDDLLEIFPAVVMVGDEFQLPPVGKGTKMALMDAEETFVLEHVYRSTGKIVAFANALRV